VVTGMSSLGRLRPIRFQASLDLQVVQAGGPNEQNMALLSNRHVMLISIFIVIT
jgi:hypothetical protein